MRLPNPVVAALVVVFLCMAPAAGAAPITITNVVVTLGSSTFTAGTVGWDFPRTLLDGQDLVLTQSSSSFSFDTSDLLGAANFAQIAITANGVVTVFTDFNQVLNVKGIDTLSNIDNEAQDYGLALTGPGYQVFLGYADNTNTGPCGAWATSIGLNGSATCLPSVFTGATYFDGAGALSPTAQTLPFHCDGTGQVANCYDAGVIRIVANSDPVPVPEPASMTLLGIGLAGLGARRWRQRR